MDEPILIDGEGQLEEDIYQIVILFSDLADEQLAKVLFEFSPSAVLRLFVELALEDGKRSEKPGEFRDGLRLFFLVLRAFLALVVHDELMELFELGLASLNRFD